MRTKLISLMIAVAVIAALCLTTAVPAVSAAEIRIGVLMPLTGFIAFFGKLQEGALKLAEKEFAKLGPTGGFDLKFIVYDTGSKPQDAILMAQKLMHTDKVHMIIGPFLSGETEQVFPIVNREKVPTVTGSSAKPGLTVSNRPWSFRTIMTSDKINEPVIRAWVKQKNIKTVAILTDVKQKVTETYGKEIAPMFLKKYGVKIVEDVTFVTDDIDFSAQVTKVKTANPDGVVLAGDYTGTANAAREMKKQGMKQPLLADVPVVSQEFIKLGGEAVEGLYAPTDFWLGNPDPKVQDFIKRFKQSYSQEKDPHTTTACFYDALYAARYVVGKAGLSGKPADLQKDREKIRDGWTNLKGFVGDAGGKMDIDKDGEASRAIFALMVKGGQWVKIPQ
jgi:branched-chain amino acid transport system substrate-binding protein